MTLDWLGRVPHIENTCIVQPDDSSIVRHAQPLDDTSRRQLREQSLARLTRDDAAIAQRERRIAIEHGAALAFERKRA